MVLVILVLIIFIVNLVAKKNHKNETVTYQHQMLTAVIAYPNYKTVLSLMLEPINKQDDVTKNDCEYNVAKRLLQKTRVPFIITAKEKDLLYLFDAYNDAKGEENLANE